MQRRHAINRDAVFSMSVAQKHTQHSHVPFKRCLLFCRSMAIIQCTERDYNYNKHQNTKLSAASNKPHPSSSDHEQIGLTRRTDGDYNLRNPDPCPILYTWPTFRCNEPSTEITNRTVSVASKLVTRTVYSKEQNTVKNQRRLVRHVTDVDI